MSLYIMRTIEHRFRTGAAFSAPVSLPPLTVKIIPKPVASENGNGVVQK